MSLNTSSRAIERMRQGVVFMSSKKSLPNVYDLPRLGAGHDGYVFQYGDGLALKLLKYDINERTRRDLMTFEKALHITENLDLKRIVGPVDVLFDEDGIYTGYVMRRVEDLASEQFKGTSVYRAPGEFDCGQLLWAMEELGEDFSQLSKKGMIAKDINRGSLLFPADYLYLCDMDKYQMSTASGVDAINMNRYRYTIAKVLFMEMVKSGASKDDYKALNRWVKQSSNSTSFIRNLTSEIGTDFRMPISEFAEQKVKTILR